MTATLQSPALSLRDYQLAAIEAVEANRNAGKPAALLILPTGTGKTIIFNSIIQRWGLPTLVLAHREELLTQARDKLLTIWPAADVGLIGGGYDEAGHRVTIASVQSASRPKRLQQLTEASIRLVVVDEAHHCPAASYLRVIEALKAGKPGGAFLLGCTATPQRQDALSLATLFGAPAYVATLTQMIANGWLTDLRGVRIRTHISLDTVHTRRGDFDEGELAQAVNTSLRNEQILEAWKTHAANRSTIVFAASVQHAHDLADTFSQAGIAAAAVDGTTPRDERRQLLADFAAGRVQVVCNMGVLTEGFDEPSTSCVILARPTKVQSLFIQMVGRGARPAPSKTNCLVLDICDVSRKHQLMQLPDLVGGAYPNRPVVLAPRNATPAEDAEFSIHDAIVAPAEAKLHSEDAQLVKVWPWVREGATYRLQLGIGPQLLLVPDTTDPMRYQIVHVEAWKRERLAPQALPLGWAQSIAEAAAENLEKGATQLVDRSAPWRSAPASDRQLYRLRQMRVPVKVGLTKGEASDLLAVAFARQSSRKGA